MIGAERIQKGAPNGAECHQHLLTASLSDTAGIFSPPACFLFPPIYWPISVAATLSTLTSTTVITTTAIPVATMKKAYTSSGLGSSFVPRGFSAACRFYVLHWYLPGNRIKYLPTTVGIAFAWLFDPIFPVTMSRAQWQQDDHWTMLASLAAAVALIWLSIVRNRLADR